MSELATQGLGDAVASRPVQAPSQGVLLLVRQMAASGIGPGEIATRLRDDFGVDGAAGVVDHITGPRPRDW